MIEEKELFKFVRIIMGIRATITIIALVITTAAISLAFAELPDTPKGLSPTIKQKKGLARELGVILKGMTKGEVRNTFGLLVP
jgi:hypothetical protein